MYIYTKSQKSYDEIKELVIVEMNECVKTYELFLKKGILTKKEFGNHYKKLLKQIKNLNKPGYLYKIFDINFETRILSGDVRFLSHKNVLYETESLRRIRYPILYKCSTRFYTYKELKNIFEKHNLLDKQNFIDMLPDIKKKFKENNDYLLIKFTW